MVQAINSTHLHCPTKQQQLESSCCLLLMLLLVVPVKSDFNVLIIPKSLLIKFLAAGKQAGGFVFPRYMRKTPKMCLHVTRKKLHNHHHHHHYGKETKQKRSRVKPLSINWLFTQTSAGGVVSSFEYFQCASVLAQQLFVLKERKQE